jgi:hypothetical protein
MNFTPSPVHALPAIMHPLKFPAIKKALLGFGSAFDFKPFSYGRLNAVTSKAAICVRASILPGYKLVRYRRISGRNMVNGVGSTAVIVTLTVIVSVPPLPSET